MPRRRPPQREARNTRSSRPATAEFDLFPDLVADSRAETRQPPSAVGEPLRSYEDLGDTFPGASAASAVAVGTLTRTARDILEGAFMPLWVRGEITDFKAHRNGHWYFCLRDDSAQLRCVVWSRDRRYVPAAPDDGMQATVFGQLTLYAVRGEMQFVVKRIETEGDGLWRKALELTRARLQADGLLAPERKRALPRYPGVIAVVTSPDGAALHDIAAVVARRAPHVRLVLVPAAVQGDSAPSELCYALDQVSRWRMADTVIVGRGGGAREDLRAFNDERVARALARCPVPTISAVGHEIDITISDLVADHRAPTPSAAAEAAVRATEELQLELRRHERQLLDAMGARLGDAAARVHGLARELSQVSREAIDNRRATLSAAAGRLHALSPLAILARGYAIPQADDGRTLASVADFAREEEFRLLLRDGSIRATPRL